MVVFLCWPIRVLLLFFVVTWRWIRKRSSWSIWRRGKEAKKYENERQKLLPGLLEELITIQIYLMDLKFILLGEKSQILGGSRRSRWEFYHVYIIFCQFLFAFCSLYIDIRYFKVYLFIPKVIFQITKLTIGD